MEKKVETIVLCMDYCKGSLPSLFAKATSGDGCGNQLISESFLHIML